MQAIEHPYGRLLEAVILMAERYATEGRWLDAFRMISVGIELANQEEGSGDIKSPTRC